VVVVVVTGSSEYTVVSRTFEAGASFLLKPCHANHLALVAKAAWPRRIAAESQTTIVQEG
jgi:FixJ family two-component response regulator